MVVITDKESYEETWAVGDKCKINPMFREDFMGAYTSMPALINRIATVVKIVSKKIKFDQGKEDGKFLLKYGKKDVYDLICLYVKYDNEGATYLVSPFGYDKA